MYKIIINKTCLFYPFYHIKEYLFWKVKNYYSQNLSFLSFLSYKRILFLESMGGAGGFGYRTWLGLRIGLGIGKGIGLGLGLV
jgi:hypothetical protein